MANIVITSTTNTLKIVFNTLASSAGLEKGTWRKDKIINFTLAKSDEYVQADIVEGESWNMAYSASGGNMVVDSIDAVSPSSNSDLYDKLIALVT